jgi:hypothetical protein
MVCTRCHVLLAAHTCLTVATTVCGTTLLLLLLRFQAGSGQRLLYDMLHSLCV